MILPCICSILNVLTTANILAACTLFILLFLIVVFICRQKPAGIPDKREPKHDYKANSNEGDNEQIYDFRHIRDISNVIKYDTLAEPLNNVFKNYLEDSDLECEVEVGAMFSDAPDHAMPINFMLRDGDKKVAVLLLELSKTKRYSVQETEALCRENGVDVLKFYMECENEKDYVIKRIRNAFN